MHTPVVKKLRKTTCYQGIAPNNNTLTSNSGPVAVFFVSGELTGKERDPETGLYYYGARYLDPRTSRWLSVDPAIGEYILLAPINDDARKHNENLPGMGGIFNYVNFHVYHYGGNNPVIIIDPDGRSNILGKSGLERLLISIDNSLNQAWRDSFITSETVREWGGVVNRSYGRGFLYTANVRTDNLASNVDIRSNRNTIAEFHTHPVSILDGGFDGMPHSSGDLYALSRENYNISIVEAGSKRFIIEITDRNSFEANIGRTVRLYEQALENSTALYLPDRAIDALRAAANDPNSGFRAYQTVDSNKLILQEL